MIRLTRSPSVVKERVDIELDGQPLMRAVAPTDAESLLAQFEVKDPAKLVEHVLVWGELEIHKHGAGQ